MKEFKIPKVNAVFCEESVEKNTNGDRHSFACTLKRNEPAKHNGRHYNKLVSIPGGNYDNLHALGLDASDVSFVQLHTLTKKGLPGMEYFFNQPMECTITETPIISCRPMNNVIIDVEKILPR